MSSSNAFVVSSSWEPSAGWGTSSPEPAAAAAFGGGPQPLVRGLFACGSMAAAAATPATASQPRMRRSSWNSSKSSIGVAPGPSRRAVKRWSPSAMTSKSDHDTCGVSRPCRAISLRQSEKPSRRFLSSRYAAWSCCSLVFASASCSEACFRSRRLAQTRRASKGGPSSWSSSRFTRTASASLQRSRARLSSGSEAMSRCSRTTPSARLSARALRCFSSSRSMTAWKTSSRRTSDLMSAQASSSRSNWLAAS
mmetsp:Transcript_82613/g.267408  ORF Transcript_82613/g.267408 Transcript_82613/m.267408 type:complete len:252 (+) Transcript_82613:1254-2009(+)